MTEAAESILKAQAALRNIDDAETLQRRAAIIAALGECHAQVEWLSREMVVSNAH